MTGDGITLEVGRGGSWGEWRGPENTLFCLVGGGTRAELQDTKDAGERSIYDNGGQTTFTEERVHLGCRRMESFTAFQCYPLSFPFHLGSWTQACNYI